MEGLVRIAARLIWAGKNIYAKKWRFFGLFFVVFLASVFVLGKLGLLPDAPPPQAPSPVVTLAASSPAATLTTAPEAPVRVSIPAINLSVTVADPTTTNVSVLDALLLRGAVRYPTSALLGENGNVVIFGHSSYLPIVGNPAYKTFDGIQKLAKGDTITVYSADAAYTYAVATVSKEKASEAIIPLSVEGKVLTLSTCNSFATTNDRFVVTADFVSSHPIATS